MKAQVVHELGGIESLQWEDIPEPEVPAGHVEIAVRAAALNFPDILIVQGLYQMRPELPFSPGAEAAGEVVSVGRDVTHFQPGDRVIAYSSHGAFSERFVVPAGSVFRMPDELSFETGSVVSMIYGTSYHALFDRADLQAGETLLVTGATGGVGSAAVQLGKAAGATVIAAVGSETKVETARELGADEVVLYGAGHSLRDQVKELTKGQGADVIYDPVGGDVFLETLRCVAWEGRILVVGFTSGSIPNAPMNLPLLKGCSIVGVFWGDFVRRNPQANAANLEEILQMAVEGRIDPVISATFPMEMAKEALQLLADRKAVGKVVLTIDRPSP